MSEQGENYQLPEEPSTLGANIQRGSMAAAGSSKEHGDALAKANEISLALRGQGQVKIGHVEDWVALLLCVSIFFQFPYCLHFFFTFLLFFYTLFIHFQMTRKDAEALVTTMEHDISLLQSELKTLRNTYKVLCEKIEEAMDLGRMNETDLLNVKTNPKASAGAQQLSIELDVTCKGQKRINEVMARKELLKRKIDHFIQESQGVLRDEYTTEYYEILKSKRVSLTHTPT